MDAQKPVQENAHATRGALPDANVLENVTSSIGGGTGPILGTAPRMHSFKQFVA